MSEKTTWIRNNFVWKFNSQCKYPVGVYRDTDSVIIRDKDTAYLFLSNEFQPDLIKLHNSTQFTDKHVDVLAKTDKRYMNFIGRFGTDHEEYVLTLYGFQYDTKEETIVFDTMHHTGNLTDLLCIFGESLVAKIETQVNATRKTYLDEHPPKKLTFFERIILQKKTPSASEICQSLPISFFMDNVNLSEMIPPLMKAYIYKGLSKAEQLKYLSHLTMVINISPIVEDT